MRKVNRIVTNGIRWLEINNGKYDYTFDPKEGWVSINYDYGLDGKRDPIGIRWKLTEEELEEISTEDMLWVIEGLSQANWDTINSFPRITNK
jgi:hypothetical protein